MAAMSKILRRKLTVMERPEEFSIVHRLDEIEPDEYVPFLATFVAVEQPCTISSNYCREVYLSKRRFHFYCSKCGTQLPDDSAFCSKCGAGLNQAAVANSSQPSSGPVGTVQVIAPTGATSLKCPSCGAPIAPKFGEMIITCEYCGGSITLGNSGWANIQKQTMLPLKISTIDEITSLVRSMMDRGLLSRHLQESSMLEEMTLSLVPYCLLQSQREHP